MNKTALIGLGYWGKNILRVLDELKVIDIACDVDSSILEERRKKYPHLKFTDNVNDVLVYDKSIKNVVIATNTNSHYDIAISALEQGKNVFVEKPLSSNYKQAKEIVDYAESKGLILMVGHILHYHPYFVKMKHMIRTGEIGEVKYVYSNRLNIPRNRTDKSVMWCFAPHDISIILSLMGSSPVNVQCYNHKFNKDTLDSTVLYMDFPNGVQTHIFLSWIHPYKEQTMVINGTRGTIVMNDLEPYNRLRVHSHFHSRLIDVDFKEPLKEEMKHFLSCCEMNIKPLTDGQEALNVIEVIQKAHSQVLGSQNSYH